MTPHEALAGILRKAQGRRDAETGDPIDVGYEVMFLRKKTDRMSAEIERLVQKVRDLGGEP
jgi:hypothetical protein